MASAADSSREFMYRSIRILVQVHLEKFMCLNQANGEEVAVKPEYQNARHPQLLYESKLYNILAGGIGIPHIKWFGKEKEHNMLVLDLFDLSLEDLILFCSRHFTLKTVLMLADQMMIKMIKYAGVMPKSWVFPGTKDCTSRLILTKTHLKFKVNREKITLTFEIVIFLAIFVVILAVSPMFASGYMTVFKLNSKYEVSQMVPTRMRTLSFHSV